MAQFHRNIILGLAYLEKVLTARLDNYFKPDKESTQPGITSPIFRGSKRSTKPVYSVLSVKYGGEYRFIDGPGSTCFTEFL